MNNHPRDDFDDWDADFAKAVQSTPVPLGLRGRLVAARPRRRVGWPVWVAAAAFVIVAALRILLPPGPTVEDVRVHLARFANSDFELELTTTEMPEIREWFAARGMAKSAVVPGAFAEMVPEGCRVVDWRGLRIGLVCFPTPDQGIVHLFSVPGLGGPAGPTVADVGGWRVLTWRENGMTYFLYSRGSADQVRALVAGLDGRGGLIRVALGVAEVPGPGAFDDGADVFELGFPAESAANFL